MNILSVLAEITIYSGIIFIVTMILKKVFSLKMSALLHYAVWVVLIARLLIPFTLSSPIRLFVLPQEDNKPAEVMQQAPEFYHLPDNLEMDASDYENAAIKDSTPIREMNNTQAGAASERTVLTWQQIVIIVWICGLIICFAYLAAVFIILRARLKKNGIPTSKKLKCIFEETKLQMGIKAKVRLVCVCEYGTPALMFPRTVIMPLDVLAAIDDEQTKHTLRHELMHYRRKDHYVSILLSLLNAFYWFNPFVWLAVKQIRLDMETACDGSVVKNFDDRERDGYASLIVRLFAQQEHKQIVLGMARANAKKEAEQRVRGIFMKQKSNVSTKAITLIIAVSLMLTCFTTACQPIKEERTALESIQQETTQTAQPTQEPEQEVIPLSESLGVPQYYTTDVTVGKLRITSNAPVDFPDTDRVPVYKVSAADFTQEQVDGLIKVLFDGETIYEWETGEPALTKELLERLLAGLEQRYSNGEFSTDEAKAQYENQKARWEKEYLTAPEENIAIVSDGLLKAMDLINNETGEKAAEYYGLIAFTGDDSARPSGILVENNNDLQAPVYYSDGRRIPLERNAEITFSMHDDYDYNFWMTPEIAVDENTVITDENVLANLKMTPKQAKELAENMLINAGSDYMKLYSMVLVDNANNGSVDGEVSDASRYAYRLRFIRTVDGISCAYIDPANLTNIETWMYETLEMYIDDRGVISFEWRSPYNIDYEVITDAQMMHFSIIKEKFEDAMMAKYETDSIETTISIDSVSIELIRVIDQNSIESGLLIPVWYFYGTITQNGVQASEGALPLLMVNAVDGSVNNTQN